jgi:hypothetical protein
MTEDEIQAQIVLWFNNNHCRSNQDPRSIIFAVPNGGKRNKYEAVKLKATGTLAGVSDLCVIHKSVMYFVEVKCKGGKQSDAQRDFESRVQENSFNYFLVFSLEDFKSLPIFAM